MNSINDNRLIAKNTIYLYIRMGLMMIVSLYTSRIILQKLGVEDYGIYNVIGSFILTFSFVSGPLGSATHRYLSYEIGKENYNRANLIFRYCAILYTLLSIVLFVTIYLTGMWFVDNRMSLPAERILASKYVLLFCLLSSMINLVRSPFESLVFAYEKMSYYAFVSIIECLLILISVLSLTYITYDRLVYYAFCQVLISFGILFCIFVYCKKHFLHKFELKWDRPILHQLLKFSGWSFLGAMATVASNQFLNILINIYAGVIYNAAMGIAMQLSGAVNKFVSNFQIAFRPQIVKRYSVSDMEGLRRLVKNSSKYSFLLLFLFICPICINAPFLLKAWLETPPPYATEFSMCLLFYVLLESLTAPMWMAVQATGTIRNYQISISCVLSLNVVLSYLLLSKGYPPVVSLIVKCLVDVLCMVVRLIFISKLIAFSIKNYIKDVLIPICFISMVCFMILVLCFHRMDHGLLRLLLSTSLFVFVFLPLSYYIVLKKYEQELLCSWILKFKTYLRC